MKTFQTLEEPILASFPALSSADLAFVHAPKLELGDVALRMFEAARKMGVPPLVLASRVAAEVTFGSDVVGVTTAGPYVNFKLDRSRFARRIVMGILGDGAHFGSNDSGVGRKVLLEHTSINPNASPHVGRARNAMIGDSLGRLLRFEGYDAEIHYYVNDMGRQIGLLVLVCGDRTDLGFDDLLELYVEANRRAEADESFAAQGYDLLAKMETGDPETQRRFRAVTDLCLKGQLAVLARLDIAYDVFDRESSYVKDPRLEPILDVLRARGALFTDDDNRLVVDLAKLGYPHEEGRFVVLMRSNGSSLYGYRDLAYTLDKAERGADLDLIVLGEDQKLYAQQLALILQAAGKEAPELVSYAHILLTEGKMSTRQGTVVLLTDFLDEAARRAAEKVDVQCVELSADERRDIARKVAVAATRFAILRVNPNRNVIFDWESSLSFTGDTGPYVQYCCARINSILRKFGEVPTETLDAFPVETDAEWELVSKLAGFPDTVASAMKDRNCAPVAQFALDAARQFTTFYHECPVLAAETPEQRIARAQVCAATRTTLENALHILGIEALERM